MIVAPTVAHRSLAATLGRVSALDPYLDGGVGRDRRDAAGWVTPAQLCADDGAGIERLLGAIGAHWQTGERRIQAAFLIGEYAWYVLAPVLGAYLVERRVPALQPDNVAVWLEPGDVPGRLGLRTRRFTALPLDPLAGDANVTLVGDEAALRDVLHDEIVAHMAPLVAAVRRRTPLGVKAQWLEVADRTASAVHYVGELTGDEERGVREAEALVHRPASPLNSPRSRFVTYEHRGVRRTVKLRGACCLSYRLPDHGYCMTCPLIDEPERAQRVRAWIADELAQAHQAG